MTEQVKKTSRDIVIPAGLSFCYVIGMDLFPNLHRFFDCYPPSLPVCTRLEGQGFYNLSSYCPRLELSPPS